MARFRELAAAEDWPAYIASISPDHHPSTKRVARGLLRSALVQFGQTNADRIVAALTPETLLALGLSLSEVRGFAEALMHTSDLDRLEALLADTAAVAPEDPVVAGLQIRLFGRMNRIGAVRRTISGRPAAFANPEALLDASEYIWLKSNEHDRLVDYIEDLPGYSGTNLQLRALRWLYRAGEEERAVRIARRYRGNAEKIDFDGILDLLANLPDREPRMVESPLSPEILIGHSSGDRAALITFAGFVRTGKVRSTGQGSVMDRYVGDLGLTMIAVKDSTHLLCLKGIPGVADTIEESVAVLKGIVSDLGLEKIYTMGGSAGGFPAVVYGLQLEAEATILFGSPTDCSSGNANVDFRAQVVARKLWRNFDRDTLDMIAWLDASDHQLPITLYYSADNRIDAWHAGRIADRPNVRAIALNGEASHQVMLEAARGRTLGEVLREGLSLPPQGGIVSALSRASVRR